MIERRGEHKMFTSPQSLKMPSLFKHLPFPKAHTPPTLRVLPKIPTKKIRVAPSCSELLPKIPTPKSPSCSERSECSQKSYRPKKFPTPKIPTPFCHCPTPHHTLSLLPKKPNQPCSQTQCFSIPPAKPKHLVVVGYTPKIPTANISPKLTPTKRKSSASPKIPFLCH